MKRSALRIALVRHSRANGNPRPTYGCGLPVDACFRRHDDVYNAIAIKRHIIRISLVMLLGVVTSVAVAWGCDAGRWFVIPAKAGIHGDPMVCVVVDVCFRRFDGGTMQLS